MQPVRIEIQWQLNLANLNVFGNCYCWDFFIFKDWHVLHTLYMRRFSSRAKALCGNLNPQLPLHCSVLQSSQTYTLFSLATRCNIFVLFCPHFAQVGNWHSRQTLCRLRFASRPNADGGKPQSQGTSSKNRLSERLFSLDFWILESLVWLLMKARCVGVFVHEN